MSIFTISWVTSIIAVLFLNISPTKSDQSILTVVSEKTLAEDGKLNFTQLVRKYGYDVEQYDVETEDGYILTLFHVPGKNSPVLLVHGIADTSDTFIIRGNTSLVITLANLGYDLWISNNRGNVYSRRHVKLNPDTDKEYWDFSFHDIGYYDLAANLDYVCDQTGEESISVIAHSQGTTAGLVLASTRTEYNEKIKVFIALAPIAFFNHLTPQLSLVVAAGPAINALFVTLGFEEILRDHGAASDLVTFICSKGIVSYVVCALGALFPFSGFDPVGIEPEFLSVIFGHYPAACSRKSLMHYDQVALRRAFGQYDYGVAGNIAKYGTENTPDYDLDAITMNVALLAGNNDGLGNIKDVQHLRDRLRNVYYEEMGPKEWSHLDFVWGKKMPKYLYPSVYKILNDFNN